ncbi:hypothetical protein [Geodermatophilus sp. SYSU D01105]
MPDRRNDPSATTDGAHATRGPMRDVVDAQHGRYGGTSLAVWLIGLLVVVLLAIAAALIGAEYNVLARLDLPSIPISGQTATTAGVVAGVAAVLATLLGAVLGGRLGTHYHRTIDRVGHDA